MPTKNAKPVNHICPGGRTKTITVELGPDQLQRVESLATIRDHHARQDS